MKTSVNTYRLGTSKETYDDIEYAWAMGSVVSDQTARTIASYWHSPAITSRNLTALSHGKEFDTDELREEIEREVTHPDDANALRAWVDHLDGFLAATA